MILTEQFKITFSKEGLSKGGLLSPPKIHRLNYSQIFYGFFFFFNIYTSHYWNDIFKHNLSQALHKYVAEM